MSLVGKAAGTEVFWGDKVMTMLVSCSELLERRPDMAIVLVLEVVSAVGESCGEEMVDTGDAGGARVVGKL